MEELVRIERDREIGIVVIDNPPVNALAQPVRAQLLRAIEQLDGDASVRALILEGAGRAFIAGADVREFERALEPPGLAEVLQRIEDCVKPVIAALHGAVLGGGAETALACRFRCAAADLELGFPEVKLGLLPGAGGTVRLPRIVGVAAALDLMTSGEPIGLARAQALALIDRTLPNPSRAGAVAYARELLAAGIVPPRVRMRPVPDAQAATPEFFRAYRAQLPRATRALAASERIIECVEAAVRESFDAALTLARARFEACRMSRESAALRRLFFAERGSSRARRGAREVRRVGIVGAGTMGSGIAASFAQSGFEVVLVDSSEEALEAGGARLDAALDAAARARVAAASDLLAVVETDLIIEAVFEDLAIKEAIFARLGRIARPHAVLATNTSTLDVEALAEASGRAADVIGMHFFSPANRMRLIEIVRLRASAPETLATALTVARRLGKVGVVVGNGFGFVGNRMFYAYGREKELMLLEGATPERIDHALEAFGMAMGPNAVGDLAGLDIGVAARAQWPDRPADPRYFRPCEVLVEHGYLGRKSGQGFYRYGGADRRRESCAEAVALIRAEARRLGVRERHVGDEEIVERCVLALINEGARILETGLAGAAADIDVIWCNGYGFPRARGGPMFHADSLGLEQVIARTDFYAMELGAQYWCAAPLIRTLAEEGRQLAEWSAPPALS
ncbi:MAG TPA: 3-hydroxyacyl-CoA dehydrogenase NAD-binding domain-containing protein [Steroidobacteraceae bacterium]|nr:3-hydroxyacyl-CoA dehydrogenase NAD-binding domain-containing protein [Steroidobacteraceae bacterium]